eukprot:967128-Amphidinium_carterae.1
MEKNEILGTVQFQQWTQFCWNPGRITCGTTCSWIRSGLGSLAQKSNLTMTLSTMQDVCNDKMLQTSNN